MSSTTITVPRKLLRDVTTYMKAKDRLLVAHRTGNNQVACAAIDKLDKLRDVPERVAAALDVEAGASR